MKRSTFRYLLVIIITLMTAIILQYLKVIDFVPEAFWISSARRQTMEERQVQIITSDEIPDDHDRYYLVYDSDATYTANTYYHLKETFRNAHIQYQDYDVQTDDLSAMLQSIPENGHLILTNESSTGFSDEEVTLLEQKVSEGLRLSVILRSYDTRLAKMSGFSGTPEFITTEGINFEVPIFPGLDEVTPDPETFPSSSLKLEISDACEVLLISDDEVPLLWEHPYGQGSVLYANTTVFQNKENRGLMLQYLLDHADYGLATVFNKKLFNIDKFPSPFPDERSAVIFSEYHRDNIKFYKDIWWSDMRDFSARYDLIFTALITGSFNDDTTPPFEEITPEELEVLEYFIRKLDEIDSELGIQGYNYHPLLTDDTVDCDTSEFTTWASTDDIVESLQYLRSVLEEKIGKVSYRTYAAPDNLGNRSSQEAVIEAFPEMKVIAGLYTGPCDTNERLLQEFGANPYFEGVYDFPRFSSGYEYTEDVMWQIFNALAELGIFNHYIHPDDIMGVSDSQDKEWKDLSKEFNQLLEESFENFPYLEGVTEYQAYIDYLHYEALDVFTRKDGNTINIWVKDAPLPTYAYLRVDHSIVNTDGVTIHSLGRDGLYFIEILKPEASLELLTIN